MEGLISSLNPFALLMLLSLGAIVGLIAGLFGVGGGLIIVPALIWGLPILEVSSDRVTHIAVGTSLATIVVTSVAAIYAHQKRRAVLWNQVALLAPGIMLGAWLGGVLADTFSGELLQRIYATFAIVVGLHLLFHFGNSMKPISPGTFGMNVFGGVIGLVSALVGIGGGTMTVPLLNAVGIEMRKAVATSSACGLPIAIVGSLSFIVAGWDSEGLPAGSSGYVYWPVALLIVISSTLFAPLGATLAHRLPGKLLRQIFAVLLFFIGGSLLVG